MSIGVFEEKKEEPIAVIRSEIEELGIGTHITLPSRKVPPEFDDIRKVEQAYDTPFRSYARYLARTEYYSQYHADLLRMKYPIRKLWYAELAYRKVAYKNYVMQMIGSQGSGKSLSALTLVQQVDLDWNIDKCFWSYETMLNYVRTEARRGDCLMLDEEPKYSGIGRIALDNAIDNLEATMRFEELNFMFVYVTDRSHKIHTMFYTRGEHLGTPTEEYYLYNENPRELIVEYFVVGVLQPVPPLEGNVLLGTMPVEVSSQKLLSEYHKRKAEFTKGMKESGGYGPERNILKEYGWLIQKLATDEVFLHKNSRGEQIHHISYNYRVPESIASLIVGMLQ